MDTTAQPLSPELVQAILAMQQQGSQQQDIARQMQMAQALRSQSAQPLQATRGGGGMVGRPNWAGAIANVMAARKAGQLEDDASVRSRNVDVQRQDAMRRYYDALTNTTRKPMLPMGDEGE